MLLNIGCSKNYLKGYKNIDIDKSVKADEYYDIGKGIKERANSVDEILLSHVLMYFKYYEVKNILKECYRVLKTCGKLKITEDNRLLKLRNEEQQKQYGGGQLFTRLEMIEFLRKVGFVNIKEAEPFIEVKHHLKLPKDYPLATGLPSVYFITAEKQKELDTPVVYLGLDDFGENNNQFDILWKLRDYFDDFKVNLFAIPNKCLNINFLIYINSISWINLCLHGYHHIHFEELDEITLKILTDKRNNYYDKVYKAPFWELTEVMRKRLKKLKFKVIELKDIDWNIDCIPPNFMNIKGTGHIYPYNYISDQGNKGSSLFWHYTNIMKLPKNTVFKHYENYY